VGCGAGHHHELRNRAIENNADVQFAGNTQALLDENFVDALAFRPGLRRDELHADHGFGNLVRLVRILRDFHATAFAAAAGVNLCLDHNRATTQLIGNDTHFFGRAGNFALRHRNAKLA
jgi:hypothetical protein